MLLEHTCGALEVSCRPPRGENSGGKSTGGQHFKKNITPKKCLEIILTPYKYLISISKLMTFTQTPEIRTLKIPIIAETHEKY